MAPPLVHNDTLYEPPWPQVILPPPLLARLEELTRVKDWSQLALAFFHDGLCVPADELEALLATEYWPPILADAAASMGDLRALSRYDFDPRRFDELAIPVMLQIGTENPRERYVTDSLAAVLPECRIDPLAGQAHEGMTTAPHLYVEAVSRFLLQPDG